MKNEINDQQDYDCWFCSKKDELLVFDGEFDTYVHLECIRRVLKSEPMNPEAVLMKYLLEDEPVIPICLNSDSRDDFFPF